MPYVRKSPTFEKMEELAGKIPAPLSWFVPDPKDPTSYIHPAAPIATMGVKNPLMKKLLAVLGEKAGKPGWLTTYRMGKPKGVAGTFFGSEIPRTGSELSGNLISASFPTKGKTVANFLHIHEGSWSGAELADAVSWHKDLPVPKDIYKKIKNKDSLDSTWAEDLIGAISAKRKGIDVLNFIDPKYGYSTTVDLSKHTEQELLKSLSKMLTKKGKGEPFNLANYLVE
jgi:hypothetical protein